MKTSKMYTYYKMIGVKLTYTQLQSRQTLLLTGVLQITFIIFFLFKLKQTFNLARESTKKLGV